MSAEPVVVAGRVGSPHGLDGSFRVIRPVPSLLAKGRRVHVDGAPRAIVRRAGTDERPIVRLEGCHDRAAAAALRGRDLEVPRGEAPPLGEDEWWATDLVGLRVTDGEREVGRVDALRALPSCEVLEVGDLLVPLVRDAVRAVDLERGVVDVDLRFLGEA
jgi:16S rRNA processing protein RimM